MTKNTMLKDRSSRLVNFTNRTDIPGSQIDFVVGNGEDGRLRYSVCIASFPTVAAKLPDRLNVTLQFERGGESAERLQVGTVADLKALSGVMKGEIDGGFDASSLAVRIIISDPQKRHLTVLAGQKGRPDDTDAEIDDQPAKPITPLRSASAPASSLIELWCDDTVRCGWKLRLHNVEMPALYLSKDIGKASLETDRRIQLAILPAVARTVIRELAFRGGEYQSEPWVSYWRKFALSLVDGVEWADLSGEEGNDAVVVETIIDAMIEAFCLRYLPSADNTPTLDEGTSA